MKEFAAWLLQGTEGPNGPGSVWGPIEIETGIALGERRDIKLVKPTPVAFVYLTGYATSDGRVHFRDDIYGLDTPAAPGAAVPDVATTGSLSPRATPVPRKPETAAPRPAPVTAKPETARPAPSPASAAPAPVGSAPKPQARRSAPPVERAPTEPGLMPPGLVGGRT